VELNPSGRPSNVVAIVDWTTEVATATAIRTRSAFLFEVRDISPTSNGIAYVGARFARAMPRGRLVA